MDVKMSPQEMAESAQCYGPEDDRHSPTTLEVADNGRDHDYFGFTCPICNYVIEI